MVIYNDSENSPASLLRARQIPMPPPRSLNNAECFSRTASGQSTEIIEKRGSCKRAAFHCLINAPQNFLHVGTPFTICLADPRASFCLQQRVNS